MYISLTDLSLILSAIININFMINKVSLIFLKTVLMKSTILWKGGEHRMH